MLPLTISRTLIKLVSLSEGEVGGGEVPGRWLGPADIVFDQNDVRTLAEEHVLGRALESR